EAGIDRAAYPLLWFGASLIAGLKDAPIAWNAPGAPGAMPLDARRGLLWPALAAADHVAARDAATAHALSHAPTTTPAIVPDTAAEVARLWDAGSMSENFGQFLRRHSLAPDDALLCLQG